MPRHLRPLVMVVTLAAVAAWGVAAAQSATPGVHPLSGRHYAGVMGYQGADWLDRTERVEEEGPDVALDAIALTRGSTVADVGAGSGYMTVKMAARVGPTGTVYANDIQPEMLALLRQRLAHAHITNVQTVLGEVDDPRLPDNGLDLVLMVDVYHEFQAPQQMLRHLHGSLKPGGRLVLLEYRKEDPSIPIRPEHKMSVAEAKLEVEAEGYSLTRVDERLPRQHILIFTRP